jgi:hypothetical protein
MRAHPPLLLLLVSLAASGCFGSSNTPPSETPDAEAVDTSVPDAAMPESDATVAESGSPDARGTVDAPADVATGVEASSGGLTVVVSGAAGPEPGITAILQDATGAVVTSMPTDASGRFVQSTIASGSQLTLLFGSPAAAHLLTIQALQPGDSLAIYDPSDPGQFAASIQSIPANPPPGTASYSAWAGACTFGSFAAVPGGSANIIASPAGTGGTSPCVSGGNFPVLVVASGGADAGNAVLGYASQANNTLVTDGGPNAVSVGGSWAMGTTASQLTALNWPDASVLYGGELAIGQVSGGVLLPSANIDILSASGPSQPLASTLYSAYGDSIQAEAYVFGENFSITDIATRGPLDGGAVALDMSQVLPLIDTATVDSTTDPGRPSVTYVAEAGSLAGADGAIVVLNWGGTTDAGATVQSTWTIVAPPTATTLNTPALPGTVAGWGPFPGASFGTPLVAVIEATFLGGYAQVRTNVSALAPTTTLIDGYPHSALLPALPADGTLRLTAYTVNGD